MTTFVQIDIYSAIWALLLMRTPVSATCWCTLWCIFRLKEIERTVSNNCLARFINQITKHIKIMTGLVASEALAGRLQETVTVTRAMVDASSGFRMYLEVGEIVTAEQLLYAALCGGYNDACVVLAYLVAGSVDAFVAQMNLRAAELGMSSTVYTNPTGMHNDRMVTTVEDSVRLARAAMENETYMRVVSTVKYTMSANN